MSLIRQVWLLLLATVLLAFIGSMGVATTSARDLLQTQLRQKNSDNAASLALPRAVALSVVFNAALKPSSAGVVALSPIAVASSIHGHIWPNHHCTHPMLSG